eukprot:SAG31_NODE_718_length_12607_cov_21.723937_11_plen_59_part_00
MYLEWRSAGAKDSIDMRCAASVLPCSFLQAARDALDAKVSQQSDNTCGAKQTFTPSFD